MKDRVRLLQIYTSIAHMRMCYSSPVIYMGINYHPNHSILVVILSSILLETILSIHLWIILIIPAAKLITSTTKLFAITVVLRLIVLLFLKLFFLLGRFWFVASDTLIGSFARIVAAFCASCDTGLAACGF